MIEPARTRVSADRVALVTDDDSTNAQDLAVAVRKPLRIVELPADLDGDTAHFLVAHESETLFPNR